MQVHELRSHWRCVCRLFTVAFAASLSLSLHGLSFLRACMHACIMYNFTPLLAKVRLSFARAAEKQLRDIFAGLKEQHTARMRKFRPALAGDKTGIIYNVSYFQRGFGQTHTCNPLSECLQRLGRILPLCFGRSSLVYWVLYSFAAIFSQIHAFNISLRVKTKSCSLFCFGCKYFKLDLPLTAIAKYPRNHRIFLAAFGIIKGLFLCWHWQQKS